jgi:hypothetical protein
MPDEAVLMDEAIVSIKSDHPLSIYILQPMTTCDVKQPLPPPPPPPSHISNIYPSIINPLRQREYPGVAAPLTEQKITYRTYRTSL